MKWVASATVLAIHDRQIAEHGGTHGVRDMKLLESALARPQQLVDYTEPDMFDLAASYAYGIIKNHPFIDGNKRTGYVVSRLFLALNKTPVVIPGIEAVEVYTAVGSGEKSEAALADWLRGCAGNL